MLYPVSLKYRMINCWQLELQKFSHPSYVNNDATPWTVACTARAQVVPPDVILGGGSVYLFVCVVSNHKCIHLWF